MQASFQDHDACRLLGALLNTNDIEKHIAGQTLFRVANVKSFNVRVWMCRCWWVGIANRGTAIFIVIACSHGAMKSWDPQRISCIMGYQCGSMSMACGHHKIVLDQHAYIKQNKHTSADFRDVIRLWKYGFDPGHADKSDKISLTILNNDWGTRQHFKFDSHGWCRSSITISLFSPMLVDIFYDMLFLWSLHNSYLS